MDEQIIECVRNKELLYNLKLKDYKNASKKQEAWEEIAAELNMTASECKTKWNLLRNAFIHAMNRRKTAGQEIKNFKKWKFEEEMAFLLPFMLNRNTKQIKRRVDKNHEDIMLNPMKARFQKRTEKNDIDLFFDSIAETVKKFPKLEQVKLKFSIMEMVHEVEMKMCLDNDGDSDTNIEYLHLPMA